MTKHTPGPWKRSGWTVSADRKTKGRCAMIADCANADMINEQWDANAALIAAAPDLLEACKMTYRAIVLGDGRTIDWNTIVDNLCAAIAKAEAQS